METARTDSGSARTMVESAWCEGKICTRTRNIMQNFLYYGDMTPEEFRLFIEAKKFEKGSGIGRFTLKEIKEAFCITYRSIGIFFAGWVYVLDEIPA